MQFPWSRALRTLTALSVLLALAASTLHAQEARRRWERLKQIRQDKFDRVLPQAMRENDIDLWLVMIREANYKTLWLDLGQGYASTDGFYAFYDPGSGRVERALFGITGYKVENAGVYDEVLPLDALGGWVKQRDPERIGVNTSRSIGPADTLSYTGYQQIEQILGDGLRDRLVSAEKLVSDFRSRRVASEIAAFAEAGEISRRLAERAFSNEVISPGVTTLEDVAWWLEDRLLEQGLGSSFGMPSIYITGPDGVEALSSDRIIQRGDLLMIDWGVVFLNFSTDMKRIAYVLRDGEVEAPEGLRHAFERGKEARQVLVETIRHGISAAQAEDEVYAALETAGFNRIAFNQPTDDPQTTDVVIGSHSVGNTGHGIGPSIAFFNPVRLEYELKPTNLLSIELFAYTANPDWGGAKVRIPLEDDAVLTERGIEWLYPANERILLVK